MTATAEKYRAPYVSEIIDRQGFGACDLDRAIDRCRQHDIGQRRHNVIGRDGLNQRR